MPGSLYIHIPFCKSKCCYCAFTSVAGQDHLFARYVAGVCSELAMLASSFPEFSGLDTLFFGGGTPTVLGPGLLSSLLERVRLLLGFAEGAEITIEANPGTVDADFLRKLKMNGCNRLSFGVQSLCGEELETLGRLHRVEDVHSSFKAARQAGFDDISLDLMYGLPGQSLASWRTTLERALALSPDHLSMYQLTIEEGTPFHGFFLSCDICLPDDETVLAMEGLNHSLCRTAGLQQYEISNYARVGHRCRHNLNYWHNMPYLAAGAGAVSYVDGVRARRVGEPQRYCDLVETGREVVEEREKLDTEAAFRETVVMGLRLLHGVDREALAARFGLDVEAYYAPVLDELVSKGLIELTPGRLRLTKRGLRFANVVMAELV